MSGNKEGFRGTPPAESGKAGGNESGAAARTPKRTSGRLSRSDQHRIGDLLQRAYDDVVNEGVPDRFKVLLDKLESGGGTGGGSGSSSPDGAAPDQQMSSQISASANSQNRESTE
jgi:hypothetical protein